MKIAYIDDFKLAVITDQGVIDISPVVSELDILPAQQTINRVIEQWVTYQPRIEEFLLSAPPRPLADVKLQAPLPKPVAIVCMAVNYMENGLLKEKPPAQAFFKNSHSVIGQGASMYLPDVPATVFEGEAEVALVIGKKATQVPVDAANEYIFGYVNFVDGSARGLATGMGLSYFMKGQDDFAPLGPWITTADEISDPMNLHVQQWNNGRLSHDYNTSDMAHNIAESLAFVTSNTTLEPGDIIALGTNHQGLHPLQDGDVVEQETQELGRLTFKVSDQFKRTWPRQTRAEWRESGNKGGHAGQLSGKYAAP